jgi:hypothetical protein
VIETDGALIERRRQSGLQLARACGVRRDRWFRPATIGMLRLARARGVRQATHNQMHILMTFLAICLYVFVIHW